MTGGLASSIYWRTACTEKITERLHVQRVRSLALRLAADLIADGRTVDICVVNLAALFHDLCVTLLSSQYCHLAYLHVY